MKKVEAQSVGEIIREVFQRAGASEQESRHRALYEWSEIVGPGVSRLTTRRYVDDNGTMHVYLASGPLKADLQFMRTRLMQQINERMGCRAIADLIIH